MFFLARSELVVIDHIAYCHHIMIGSARLSCGLPLRPPQTELKKTTLGVPNGHNRAGPPTQPAQTKKGIVLRVAHSTRTLSPRACARSRWSFCSRPQYGACLWEVLMDTQIWVLREGAPGQNLKSQQQHVKLTTPHCHYEIFINMHYFI